MPALPHLLVPRAKANKDISIQIKEGREILKDLALTQSGSTVDIDTGFARIEADQEKWAKYTIHLLKTLFTEGSIAREFGDYWIHCPEYEDMIEVFRERMDERIQSLESIVQRLPLFPLAAAKGTSVQSNKGKPVVQGHETGKHEVGNMKVFISWSGDISHQVALFFRDWLPAVLPFIEPWVSSEDIPKGTRWSNELAGELEDTQAGIICLVPGNLTEPWLNFEAGALSKSVTTARIHPFLLGVEPGELPGPLAQFQATCFSKKDVRKLIDALNAEAGDAAIPAAKVERVFNACWAGLESQLAALLIEVKKDVVRAETDTTKAEQDVTAEALTLLELVANSPGIGPKVVAEHMGVHHQRARHIMEDLQDKRLLTRYTSSMGGFIWSLSKAGRAFLVKKNLL